MVCDTFLIFIFQSAKKSFYVKSLHIDLNKVAKFVDIAYSNKIQNGDDIWPNLLRFTVQFMKFEASNLGKTRLVTIGKVTF